MIRFFSFSDRSYEAGLILPNLCQIFYLFFFFFCGEAAVVCPRVIPASSGDSESTVLDIFSCILTVVVVTAEVKFQTYLGNGVNVLFDLCGFANLHTI